MGRAIQGGRGVNFLSKHALPYLPGLDGLRALAVLSVLLVHCDLGWTRGGFIGVDVFFVLSGYLITRLLTETQPQLRDFYVRRLIRLTPPLCLMLAGFVAAAAVLEPQLQAWRDASIALLYLSDYEKAFFGIPEVLGHTWSLAVEEHFYLLWPLVLYRFRPSVKALIWAFILATAWRAWSDAGWYFRFDTRASGLILGCIIANFPRDRFPAWPGLLLLGFFGIYLRWSDAYTHGPGITMVELAAAVAVLGYPPAWLHSEPLRYLGKLSYGVYLWQSPIAYFLLQRVESHAMVALLTFTGATLLAALSYHTIEAWSRLTIPKLRRTVGVE